MIWTEIKIDDYYDFCIQSGDWLIMRKGEHVGLCFCNHRFRWCNDVEEGMFTAWMAELRDRRTKCMTPRKTPLMNLKE